MTSRILNALALAMVCSAVAFAQVNPEQLQQALQQRTYDLGKCNAELGPVQMLQASKQLIAPAEARANFIAEFEKANPSKTLDAALKVIDKP